MFKMKIWKIRLKNNNDVLTGDDKVIEYVHMCCILFSAWMHDSKELKLTVFQMKEKRNKEEMGHAKRNYGYLLSV